MAGLVAFLIYKGLLSAREAKAERARGLRTLGFEPVETPPEDVRDAILALHRRGKTPGHKIDEVFERRSGSDRFFLFDLEDSSGDTDHTGVMAVLSPRLHSPRLTISPRLEGEGRLASLGNLLLKRVAHHQGQTVDFTSHSRFSRRHFVSGPDPEAIRRFRELAEGLELYFRTVEPEQTGERRITIETPTETPMLHMAFHGFDTLFQGISACDGFLN